jgi:hypothetical protein
VVRTRERAVLARLDKDRRSFDDLAALKRHLIEATSGQAELSMKLTDKPLEAMAGAAAGGKTKPPGGWVRTDGSSAVRSPRPSTPRSRCRRRSAARRCSFLGLSRSALYRHLTSLGIRS